MQDPIQKVKQIIADCLTRLPEEQQTVLSLRYVEGLSFTEIAAVMCQKEAEVRRTYIRGVTTCLDFKQRRHLITS